MTFSRTLKSPVNFLAYKNTTESPAGEGLHIQIGISHVDLDVTDALAFANYIQDYWQREKSE